MRAPTPRAMLATTSSTPIADEALANPPLRPDLATALDESALTARIRRQATAHRALACEIAREHGLAIAVGVDGAAWTFLRACRRDRWRRCGKNHRQPSTGKYHQTHRHRLVPAVTGFRFRVRRGRAELLRSRLRHAMRVSTTCAQHATRAREHGKRSRRPVLPPPLGMAQHIAQ